MKTLFVGLALALALTSCTTTGTSKVDAAIEKNLPTACNIFNIGYLAFTAVAASGKIKASVVTKVDAAQEGITLICADPSNTTAVNAAIKVAQAYTVVTLALKDAKNAEIGNE